MKKAVATLFLQVTIASFSANAQQSAPSIPPLPPPPFSSATPANTFEFINLRTQAEQGDAEAQCEVGIRYGRGDGIAKDPAESVKWLRKSAEQNNARAQYYLGAAYYFGIGLTIDYKEAVRWFGKAAEQNNAEAQANLGGCYMDGKGVPRDEVEARKWLEKAATQGNKDAEKNLTTLRKRQIPQPEQSAEASNPSRENESTHVAGESAAGASESSETGLAGIKTKAEAGDAFAQAQLGVFYMSGDGVRKSANEAVKWFRKSAGQNNAAGEYNLGVCYAKGLGTTRDMAEACKWYTKAAQQNYAEAQFNLGLAYFEGQGVKKDAVTACKLFQKAAVQNDSFAQGTLGFCYMNGLGVPRDDIQAYKWTALAVAQGNSEVQRNLAMLEKKMARPEIAQGQKLAREFKPVALPAQSGGAESGSSSGNGSLRAHNVGTGFFITEDGYLITNFHVIKGGAAFRLKTNSGQLSATVIKEDQENDLALLKVDGEFVALPVASSRGVKLGDNVATVGFPDPQLQGYSPKYTRGEINSLAGSRDNDHFFQISTQIQPGNSGGALVDIRGNVVGVTSSGLNYKAALQSSGRPPEDVNYAIKSSFILSFLESVPELSAKLKEPHTDENKPSDVIEQMEKAAALVIVYWRTGPEQSDQP